MCRHSCCVEQSEEDEVVGKEVDEEEVDEEVDAEVVDKELLPVT